ncbi:M15 family metallopeptidase, partial [Clostridioides difficile]
YEPWHNRYIGTDLAPDVAKSGLTLEEYFDEANIKL